MTIERVSSSFPSYEPMRSEQAKGDVELSAARPQEGEDSSPSQPLSEEKLEKVVNGLNELVQPSHTSVRFELHKELNEYYVQVIDEKTHEVIREIPPKKLLDMYAAMMEFVGLLVDKKI
ncbi:flagellar biosynthesis protein FlaG [Geobacillus thermoleovorans]|uniref:Flagellar protein FlaG n=1 Tax=Geobacillus proteiniphilus TaxID=860353 RepID=A0ABY9MEZ0_9BACL|nr:MULTISPECIES: flagellar protein FlaG [Geobacillus]AMV12258.1 flagellar biosynthesis protein FlaG [Geobacillus thermoleovorans]OPX00974.1 flagellar biosynthesis protein FlaG [Geobacillus sp. LEMMY01]WMJ16565.1 flagellar protein FlaG [Geobacillus proteiniphilus]